ncbi:hypothetical protein Q5P01_011771 [Channa striata]|uniref:Cystein proteinase inhibitor protein salarin n=1 Tax=Channa striata TaxID=64152 RepID=A0AA88SR38_CHASR|nr:hypothetical protein Q5P01_011771 [Channa striata]
MSQSMSQGFPDEKQQKSRTLRASQTKSGRVRDGVRSLGVTGVCVLTMESSDSDKLDKANLDAEWEQWKIKFNKTYKNAEEESYRRGLWDESKRLIEVHNREAAEGKHSFTMGINQFSDMKHEEVCCGGLKQKRCCGSRGKPGQTHK